MERREFIKRLALLAACPLCAKTAYAAEAEHWSYEGEAGPEHWGSLNNENSACSAGSQQSPLDIRGAIKADIPGLALNWKSGGAILNNGHTIQVKAAPGGTLRRGDKPYELVQYHSTPRANIWSRAIASRWRSILSINTPKRVHSACWAFSLCQAPPMRPSPAWRRLSLKRPASRPHSLMSTRAVCCRRHSSIGPMKGLSPHHPAARSSTGW